ncbi:MAG: 2-amino-4-hydroxy-6-hydroxymethyldihydropteridine diphosphokinase [Alistipes sp.]|nr:2-amino-4-hydroxy-6-hydroxymethyldihydropteridine diphosphokinase [Alistipes sp.]
MVKEQHRVALLTGSNAPEREAILRLTAELVAQHIGTVERSSQIHASAAWGFECNDPFANQALVVVTTLSPEEVLTQALSIEQMVGRNREAELKEKQLTGQRYASRVVDVDVIFYDDLVVESERLTLPHRLMHEREFVLRPLREVAAEWQHPLLKQSVEQMLRKVEDKENKN